VDDVLPTVRFAPNDRPNMELLEGQTLRYWINGKQSEIETVLDRRCAGCRTFEGYPSSGKSSLCLARMELVCYSPPVYAGRRYRGDSHGNCNRSIYFA